MAEWKEAMIVDLGEVVTGKTPSSKNPEDFGDAIPFITPTDYKYYNKWAEHSDRYLSRIGVDRLEGKVLPPRSVLVTCIGSDMGKVVLNRIPVITNQQINSVIPKNEIVDSDFLYYCLVFEYDNLRVLGQSGTAVPIVNKGDFERITLTLPPLPEQRAIASVLSSLDDKIDLLHRQNKTLEALAETVFREWFVEVKRETGKFGDFVKTTSGGTPSRTHPEYYENGTIGWVKSKELSGSFIFETEERITQEALENSSAKLLPQNSILIAMYGATVGEYAILAEPATCNQAVCAVIPNDDYPYTYLFSFIKHNKEYIKSVAVGSAQQNVSQILIKDLEVAKPNSRIREYHSSVEPYFYKMKSNHQQIRTLTQLRDTLLPKLMSGKVRVKLP